jgi:hypothetical protein
MAMYLLARTCLPRVLSCTPCALWAGIIKKFRVLYEGSERQMAVYDKSGCKNRLMELMLSRKLAAANGRDECASVMLGRNISSREGKCYTEGKSKTSNSIDRLKLSFFTLIAATRFAPWIVTLTLFL